MGKTDRDKEKSHPKEWDFSFLKQLLNCCGSLFYQYRVVSKSKDTR
jgi:hypothetical protein